MEKRFRVEIVSTDADALLAEADLLDKVAKRRAVCIIGPESALDSCSDVLLARLEI